jgi:two-component system, OmpR family, response regulator
VRVLLIEDDRRLAHLISKVLEDENYSVDVVHEGDTGLELALRGIHDIAIIDWMLPGRDGPSICRAIRAARLPIVLLLLTARSQVEDQVAGLDSGADDYLAKPFAFDVLMARLRALTRRSGPVGADGWELRVGRLVMDLKAHSVRRSERALELTKTEWNLLEYLLRHPNQALSRQNILDYVWSYEAGVKSELVDVYISYLRQKLNQPGLPDPIKTVRGIGYQLEARDA